MKKTFVEPNVEVLEVHIEDVLTDSDYIGLPLIPET